jgi:hypothetical protein
MAEFDVFLSYASLDLPAAEVLETWLQAPPRSRRVWRDRRRILPGSPDYYVPIAHGIEASATFLVLLSSNWLGSAVAVKELSDARAAGKKLLIVVHPDIARDPVTAEGCKSKREVLDALDALGVSEIAGVLNRPDWIWPREDESTQPDFAAVERALATDYAWAARHAVIVERLARWNELRDVGALLRGAELSELMTDAFTDVPGRNPVLTPEQRAFLLESQRQETAEIERTEGLYWGAQTRAAAFAARERAEVDPDLALLLAAEAVSVAPVPEARSALLSILHRHAPLSVLLLGHGQGRWISGLAFSPDGHWLASGDRPCAIGDNRQAHLLIYEAETGREWERIGSNPVTALAWGARWLAVGSEGSIGWLRWAEFDEKFRGNTPVALQGGVSPDYLAFSLPEANEQYGEVLAWGTQWGDIGLIRVGDHVSWQGRVGADRSSSALAGLGWLADGRLITAENGRVLIRPFPTLEPTQEIARMDAVFSLACDGRRWIAACQNGVSTGLLLGEQAEVRTFQPGAVPGASLTPGWFGPQDQRRLIIASATARSAVPTVALTESGRTPEILLQGEDQLVKSIAGDSFGRFVAAGEFLGRVWLWDRSRRSHLVSRYLPGVSAASMAVSSAGPAAVVSQDARVHWFENGLSAGQTAEAAMPFAPARLLTADAGRTFIAVSSEGRAAALQPGGATHDLQGLPKLDIPTVVAVAAEAPIIAVLEPGNQITVARICASGFVPVRIIDPGATVIALALDPSGHRLFATVARFGLDVLSWIIDSTAVNEPTELFSMRNAGIPPIPMRAANGRIFAGDEKDLVMATLDEFGPAVWASGHDEPVRCIAAGGHIVASVACWFQDTNVDQLRLWTGDFQPLGAVTLPEHASDIAILPDGNAVIAVGRSGALWRLTLDTEDWITAARRIAGRLLTAEEERRYGIDTWRARLSRGVSRRSTTRPAVRGVR